MTESTGPHEEPTGATLAGYRAALGTPGVGLPVIASVIGRLPIAMGSIAILIYVQQKDGTFMGAGFVSGGALVGLACGSVVQGRLVDRFGAPRPLRITTVLFLAVSGALFYSVEQGASLLVLVTLSICFGATQPALAPASRALWPRLVSDRKVREAAYGYEAISLEVFFILGPALAAVLASTRWPGMGLATAVTMLVSGTLLFTAAPVVRRWGPEPGDVRTSSWSLVRVLSLRGMPMVVALALGYGLTIGFVEAAVPAEAIIAGVPAAGGLLLGAWSLTSVLFGIAYAARPWPTALHLRGPILLAGFSVLVALMALPPGLIGLALMMLLAGTLITPQAATHSLLVERAAPDGAAAEGFGWVITAIALGLAAGYASAGTLIDAAGPRAALLAAGGVGLVVAAVTWVGRSTLALRPAPAPADERVPA